MALSGFIYFILENVLNHLTQVNIGWFESYLSGTKQSVGIGSLQPSALEIWRITRINPWSFAVQFICQPPANCVTEL